ncbi:hypothetical protein BGW36DRAFT_316147 [Talaromyces proteolyticus]|uniref:Uncharacterized protein n=1 Tax=Talaromyces proteolyticus TaxID=1131652 RepID=A0AAD4KSY2_9EURO|nr:uncharacterized protein BGW36DRAFT_316147 [Talaromyces proteolyticus]KAH8700332.1 hypothetical protein BGW36DRAFT_316147 [Talaromyces proteolyticus]
MSKPDPLSWTLRFKKHKTTVLLMIPAQESIQSTKQKLLHALHERGIKDINGDAVPTDHSDIELGVPIDRNHLNKGWVGLEGAVDENSNGSGKKSGKNGSSGSLQAANIRNGQPIAFRFKTGSDDDDEDPKWDVVIPALDDEEPE